MMVYHQPVLLKESVDFLVTDLGGTYIDATFGGGGHTRELLARISAGSRVFAFDVDENSETIANGLALRENRLHFVRDNFANLREVLQQKGISSINGALFDLGVSSHQFDYEPGFSYRREERLDLRMDRRLRVSAYDIVNTYDTERLADVFFKYGEEPRSRSLANAIVKQRAKGKFDTTIQLADLVNRICGHSVKSLSRIFQAIRIEVNGELQSLSDGLDAAINLLLRGGRIVVLTYHSLEDRIVKEKFKYESASCVCPPSSIICTCGKVARIKVITRKPVVPTAKEAIENRRSRSAKLRVAEKVV